VKLIRKFVIVIVLAIVASVVGPPVSAQAAVQSCTSSTPIASRPTLRYADSGTCVVVAQKLLLAKNYSLGGYTASGNYLTFTRDAVLRFQKNNALTQNGTVDQPTWKKLAASPPVYNQMYGPNYTSRVVLTYDDCPRSLTEMKTMVRYAKSINVGLVLAPTGDCIRAGLFDAAYARAYGQYVINHSVSHPNFTTLTYSQLLTQLSAPGVVTNYGRPPGGALDAEARSAYATKKMNIWTWNVDTNDWRGKTMAQVVSYVIANAYARATVLMHMQHKAFNPTALNQMVTGMKARGKLTCRPYPGVTPQLLPSQIPC
jgi:peptidoglycan hydrolase-like protein with peptidoglycan-binding domain